MTCKSCKHTDVTPDALGRYVMRRNHAYLCTVEVPTPKLPYSVASHYSFRWPPARSYVNSASGEGCPLYRWRAPTEKATKP